WAARPGGGGAAPPASTSFFRLYSIHVSMTSGVNTSPLRSQSWLFSRLSSTMLRSPGSCLIFFASAGGSSYRSLSTGLPGSILLAMPSRPAIRHAENERYGLQVGSGVRNSMRLAPSDFEYIGMRMHAERLRWLYTRLIGAS